MRILRLSCLLLLWGCASRNNADFETLGSEGGLREARWRECSWNEVSDWLASDPDCRRDDGVFGYECFTATTGLDRCVGDAKVWFSPCFGKWAACHTKALTVVCQNWTKDLLPIKGFPGCCEGVELSGWFDMSNVIMRDSVEYFHSEARGISDLPRCYEEYIDLPRFKTTSNLKHLSIKRYSSHGDDYRKRRLIPCLDMTQFSEIATLESVDVFIEGLALHAEKLLGNDKLRDFSLWESYGYFVDPNDEGARTDSGLVSNSSNSPLRNYVVDDASFDEFIKRDFTGIGGMRVEIKLSNVRTWNIAHLANINMDVLSVSTENCLITGVEAFRNGLGPNWLSIDMDISRRDRAGDDLHSEGGAEE